MFLRTLYLHNFRCYQEAFFEFCPGINTICGANAQGKTSLLEAIYLLIAGKSFRTSQVSDLTRLGTNNFFIEASFVKHGIEQQLRISCNGKERKIFHNHNLCPSSSLLGLLRGVVITPDDAALVKGSPLVRRHFLDLQIAQIDPLYVHHLGRYNRALRQRNALLRAKSHATLDSWEFEMATSAAYLTMQRSLAVQDLEKSGRRLHKILSGEGEEMQLVYKNGAPLNAGLTVLRTHFLEQFQKLRYREMILGATLSGPQKDDLTVAIAEKEVRFFASEGQQRSCVAALRFAEWERLNELGSEAPLMLIDDVGVSLDSSRKDKLLTHIQSLGQVFLTATQEMTFTTSLDKEMLVIPIV